MFGNDLPASYDNWTESDEVPLFAVDHESQAKARVGQSFVRGGVTYECVGYRPVAEQHWQLLGRRKVDPSP